MRRIMLATNAGADARVLHVAALRRADASSSDLAVVHVIDGGDYQAQPDQLQDAIRSETEWLLHTMMGLAADRSGVEPVSFTIHVRDGDVADELLDFASATQPDAVLLGVPRDSDRSHFAESEFEELLGRFEHADISVERIETD